MINEWDCAKILHKLIKLNEGLLKCTRKVKIPLNKSGLEKLSCHGDVMNIFMSKRVVGKKMKSY